MLRAKIIGKVADGCFIVFLWTNNKVAPSSNRDLLPAPRAKKYRRRPFANADMSEDNYDPTDRICATGEQRTLSRAVGRVGFLGVELDIFFITVTPTGYINYTSTHYKTLCC